MTGLKKMVCFLIVSSMFALGSLNAQAGVLKLENVWALDINGVDIVSATAVHGFLLGNDAAGDDPLTGGDPLLEYLNKGYDGPYSFNPGNPIGPYVLVGVDDWVPIQISEEGMFSSTKNDFAPPPGGLVTDPPTVDLVDGAPVFGAPNWKFLGKSDDLMGPFEMNVDATSGSLMLNSPPAPLSGNVVISFKAGDNFSVYAFAGLSDVYGFRFDALPQNLSHASIYSAQQAAVPEPASLAIFGLGGLGMGLMNRRRKAMKAANRV